MDSILGIPLLPASSLRNQLFDSYQRHTARDTPVSPVRVLELPVLDEDSLVDVTRRLALQGAALVVFTAPMQPGPSPQSLSARLPPGSDAARAALARLPEPGHDLAAALQDIPGIMPVVLGAPGRLRGQIPRVFPGSRPSVGPAVTTAGGTMTTESTPHPAPDPTPDPSVPAATPHA